MKLDEAFVLPNAFLQEPVQTDRIETRHRRIVTPLPAPGSLELLSEAVNLFPQVNCYQPPIVWDRAEGFQVYDGFGNCWIDLSSTAVMTNSGHAHPRIRQALNEYVKDGMLAHFNFPSQIRVELARRLIALAPDGMEKVCFWTTGSEALESALRMVRQFGMRKHSEKHRVLCISGDYHGCTLGAHQMSGGDHDKHWIRDPDPAIRRIPFPTQASLELAGAGDWDDWVRGRIEELGDAADNYCGVFIETLQGWGALPLPAGCVQALRRWADEHDALLVFDEVQTGFGRTGKWFGHQHYGVAADLICIGKGVSSTLPLSAVLGPAEVLDVQTPGEVMTTHAGHPVACAAAIANLEALQTDDLVNRAAQGGELARRELNRLQQRFPEWIEHVSGLGLLNAIHLRDPETGEPSRRLASELSWQVVLRGGMVFRTNKPSVKFCPPLVITDEAIIDGAAAVEEALERLTA